MLTIIFKLFSSAENDITCEYLEQSPQQVTISTAVFLLRNANTAVANIAAINTKQHGDANSEKLNLETLVRSLGAKLQIVKQ